MKYSREERLEIGRRMYTGEINRAEAAVEYDIGMYTARDYMRLYKAYLKRQGAQGTQGRSKDVPDAPAKAGLSPAGNPAGRSAPAPAGNPAGRSAPAPAGNPAGRSAPAPAGERQPGADAPAPAGERQPGADAPAPAAEPDYESMSREDLIREIKRLRAEAAEGESKI